MIEPATASVFSALSPCFQFVNVFYPCNTNMQGPPVKILTGIVQWFWNSEMPQLRSPFNLII
jgi:hypothetical protein